MKRIFAWVRVMVWGFCPSCNSSAPKLYDCKVCNYDRDSPFNLDKKRELWNKYKEYE